MNAPTLQAGQGDVDPLLIALERLSPGFTASLLERVADRIVARLANSADVSGATLKLFVDKHEAEGEACVPAATVVAARTNWPAESGWDLRPGEVSYNGIVAQFTGKRYSLLYHLAQHLDYGCTERDLIAAVWPDIPNTASGTVQYTVSQLRKWLKTTYKLPHDFHPISCHMRGYRLHMPQLADFNAAQVRRRRG